MNPEMWWAQTDVAWSWYRHSYDVNLDGSRILVGAVRRDPYAGRGFRLTSLRALVQFGLGRERQPTTSTLFSSSPRLYLDGHLETWAASYPPGETIFRVWLRQTGQLDGEPILLSTDGERSDPERKLAFWVETGRTVWRHEEDFWAGVPLRFSPLNIWLDGSRDLSIQLEVTIELFVRSVGYIELTPRSGESAVSLFLPQWNLVDVRDIL